MTYYIAPRFLDKVAVHITKNFLDLPRVKVPLILGVHGRKGEGKTFQCELVFQRLGVEVVHISGGELESPDAGDPARLIRLRYREAAELVRVRGKMAVLMINDLDAGAGRFDAVTQYTVNTQLVNNTLMNIADQPTNVQLPGSYDDKPIQRIPIIVTGNDFSTLYAPLVRDGRMEKFYWEPDRDDKIGIVRGMFAPDGLAEADVIALVDRFLDQSIDFFGALRSRIYDDLVRQFVHSTGFEQLSLRVVNSESGKPQLPTPDFSLPTLLQAGTAIVQEQRRLTEMRLAREYNAALNQTQVTSPSARGGRDRSNRVEPSSPAAPVNTANGRSSVNRHAHPATDLPLKSFTPAGSAAAPSCPPRTNGNTTNLSATVNPNTAAALDAATIAKVKTLLHQGYRLGLEHVDQRRFRTNAWESCPVIATEDVNEAIAALTNCLRQYPQDYVRVIGINPNRKQRVWEEIIQRP